MPRNRKTLRRTCRRPATHTCRALTRSTARSLPGRRHGLKDLSQALTAFGRAIRCYRRLALARHQASNPTIGQVDETMAKAKGPRKFSAA